MAAVQPPAPQPAARPVYSQPVYQQPQPQPAAYPPQPSYPAAGDARPPAGSKYEPISVGGFIGIMLLMMIPIVGVIITIVWACGGCRKVTKQNLARAMLIVMAVCLILSIALGFAIKKTFQSLISSISEASGLNGPGDLSGLVGGYVISPASPEQLYQGMSTALSDEGRALENGATQKDLELMRAVYGEDREALSGMGYSQRAIDEALKAIWGRGEEERGSTGRPVRFFLDRVKRSRVQ